MSEVIRISTLREVYNNGCRRVCMKCKTVFKPGKTRKEHYEDGHIGREIEMCFCGCDLIGYVIEGEDGKLYICRENKIDKDSICYE